jgi:SAM-dependent methyltransferase
MPWLAPVTIAVCPLIRPTVPPGREPGPPDNLADVPEGDDAAKRALVRRGYDAISRAYRTDDGASNPATGEDASRYLAWVDELASLLPGHARVLDLGCGAGVPGTLALTRHGLQVAGVDFSPVQLARARTLVPAARFVQADMAAFSLRPASVDAVTAFYSLIHLPVPDQRALLPRLTTWLRPGGFVLAIVGAAWWTGTEDYLGADMFWDHADTRAYLEWFGAAGLTPRWHRYIPEGNSGHTLILASADPAARLGACLA